MAVNDGKNMKLNEIMFTEERTRKKKIFHKETAGYNHEKASKS